jgi:hypothetical protein
MKERSVPPPPFLGFVYDLSIHFDFQTESVDFLFTFVLSRMLYSYILSYVLINIHDVRSREIRLMNKMVRISPYVD